MDHLENCSSQLNARTCNAGTDHRTHVTLTDLSGEDWKRTEKRLSCARNNVVLSSEFTGVDHFEDWRRRHSSLAPLDISQLSHEQRTRYLQLKRRY